MCVKTVCLVLAEENIRFWYATDSNLIQNRQFSLGNVLLRVECGAAGVDRLLKNCNFSGPRHHSDAHKQCAIVIFRSPQHRNTQKQEKLG